MPAPASQARVSQNNRDLTKVSEPRKNNFVDSTTATTKQHPERKKPARPSSGKPSQQKTSEDQTKKEKVKYADVSLGQPADPKKFFKYEPKQKKLPVVIIPKKDPSKTRLEKSPQVAAD